MFFKLIIINCYGIFGFTCDMGVAQHRTKLLTACVDTVIIVAVSSIGYMVLYSSWLRPGHRDRARHFSLSLP